MCREDDWWYAQKVEGGELGYLPASFLAPYGSLDAEEYASDLSCHSLALT